MHELARPEHVYVKTRFPVSGMGFGISFLLMGPVNPFRILLLGPLAACELKFGKFNSCFCCDDTKLAALLACPCTCSLSEHSDLFCDSIVIVPLTVSNVCVSGVSISLALEAIVFVP